MRALLFDGEARVVDVPMPWPKPGEALVRVLSAGICNTDLELLKGYMNFKGILGHEFVGIAEECSNEHLRGKRVVGEINCVCHRCKFCQLEMTHHCLNRSVLGILNRNGAFAEFITLPEENLHLVPQSIKDDVAVFAEPTAAAFRIFEQITLLPEDRIIILGDGKLGQLIAQVLFTQTKNILVVGRHHWKLELLRNRHIPAVHVDEPLERGADIVVEATGSHEGFARALELVRPEGTIVVKTTVTHPTAFDLSVPVVNEVTVIGSRCGPFRPALEALASGDVEVRPLVTETFDLRDAHHALRRATAPDAMKVVLHM
jgi:threonine dehydrogenase-like Zn-dependent dehydrogenase